MASGDQIPQIQTFQLDQGAIGNVRNSVNLFRGDVNFTQTLFRMPGRTADSALAVGVVLIYQSNVYRAATTWNLDAPTGAIGLGWSMPVTCIRLDDGQSPTSGAWSYSYASGDTETPLIQEPTAPFLFSMDPALASGLRDGATVTAGIVAAFAGVGLAVSRNAILSAPASGSTRWTLTDNDGQRLFTLEPGETALAAYDGGLSFQLQNYAFQKILYYPPFERWVVVAEDGTTLSFGGLAAKRDGYNTSVGNSVEWGVRWTSPSGAALWVGPSTLTTSQIQYAKAWHLAGASDVWGNTIAYGYNEWTPDQHTNLIPEVEQLVGAGGLPYTKACYLTSITDVFGRKATFRYANKLWNADATSPREYADPHKTTPDTSPNAYQDRYETKYLAGIAVQDQTGAPLLGITLQHGLPQNGVANVTRTTGPLYGDTFKRFLTGIVLTNASGQALPGIRFAYYLEPTGPSPGALQSVTYPQGAVATYTYSDSPQILPMCNRTITVAPPTGMPSGSQPFVWFGSDYAVTVWWSATTGLLSLVVYTWLGRWQPWQMESSSALICDQCGDLDPTTLDAVGSTNYFAVYFNRVSAARAEAFVFRKDPARPGQWVSATVDGVTTALNVPTLSYSIAQGTATFVGGDNFLIGGASDVIYDGPGLNTYDRLTWSWIDGAWIRESFAPDHFIFVAAQMEYYVTLDAVTGTLSLFYLDPASRWQQGASSPALPDFPDTTYTNVALATDSSTVAVSHLVNIDPRNSSEYDLTILHWDGAYNIQPPETNRFIDYQENTGNYATSWSPAIVGNRLVASAGNLLRFNGSAWLKNSTLAIPAPAPGLEQRFAYGADYALQIAVYGLGNGEPYAMTLGFDPDADSSQWSRSATATAQCLPPTTPLPWASNWPSVGRRDYAALGQYLYFRGTETDWQKVFALPPLIDMQALVNSAAGSDTEYLLSAISVVNEAPDFLAYALENVSTGGPGEVAGFVLANGQVAIALSQFADETMWALTPSGANLSGQYPGGPFAFVTYPASTSEFPNAPLYHLHHYAGDAIDGPLVHYAVTQLSVDNGFGEISVTNYEADPSDAACDPTGLVVKYYKTTAYPGGGSGSNPVQGSVVTTYLNGLQIQTGANFYDMLDGLLHQVQILDSTGKVVSQTTNAWQAYTQRASDPSNSAAPILNLYGGYVRRIGQTRMLDGVSSTVETSFLPPGFAAPYSGLPVSSTKVVWGGGGQQETFASSVLYGYDVNPTCIASHLLTPKAQTLITWAAGTRQAVPVKSTVSTITGWTNAAGLTIPGTEGDFVWNGEGSADFPFGTYQPGRVPPGWVRPRKIIARSPLGLVTESIDAAGTITSTLYGSQTFPVAEFVNASLSGGECAYIGFEPYETQSAFAITGASIVVGDAHTGSCSLQLPAGTGATLSTEIQPAADARAYLLGYWHKTPAGFAASSGSGWTITITANGRTIGSQSAHFTDTGGLWAYATVGINLRGAPGLILEVSAMNTSTMAVLLDDVFVAPLVSQVLIRTFDPGLHFLFSTMRANGVTQRTCYDAFLRTVAIIGADGQAKEYVPCGLSRQGNAAGAFDPANPNTEITIHPAAGGLVETFLSGDEWTSRWRTADPAAWSASGGSLTHTGSTGDTLSWIGWRGAAPATAAVAFELSCPASLAGPVAIGFGSGHQISWDPSDGWKFAAPRGDNLQNPLITPPGIARSWLLVIGCGAVLFFADGQLVLSVALSTNTSDFSISTGPNALSFRNIAVLAEPRLGMAYVDAAGRQRQVQQLLAQAASDNSDARVLQKVHDSLNREIAVTRIAPGSFGSGAALPLLAYRPGFVDVADFLASLNSSWRMTGDVANYYAGQSDGPVPRSDDQGYPYRGIRYDTCRLKRPLERGLPGLAYAIHDVNTTAPADRATVQISYSANGASFPDLHADCYLQRGTTSAVKNQSLSLRDTAGRAVATALLDPDGNIQSETEASFFYNDSSGVRTIRLPNAFTSGPQKDPSAFRSTETQDTLGRTIGRCSPATGASSYIYDPRGLLRFVQPQLAPGQQVFIYYRYDALGRRIEEGLVQQPWNSATLRIQAADPKWPDSTVPHSVTRTHIYDGDGNTPTSIGRRVEAGTTTLAPQGEPPLGSCTVTETFAYDILGRIVTVQMAIDQPESATAQVSYRYNNLNQVVVITYPAGSPISQVFHTYDDQGRVIGIGSTPTAPTNIAAYTYTMDGQVQTETRNTGKLVGIFTRASPGWLLQESVVADTASSPCFTLQYQYNADGTVRDRTVSVAFGESSFSKPTSYAYDAQQQLISAQVGDGAAGTEAISGIDADGNIWAATLNGSESTFAGAPGTDHLQQAVIDGAPTAISYGPAGLLTTRGALSLQYDLCLALPLGAAAASLTAGTLRFAYGAQGQRVVKQPSGGTPCKLYLYGAGRKPIAILQGGAWTAFVYGPAGCTAVVNDQTYFPLQDAQGTIWAICDSANALAAQYQFSSFGVVLSSSGPALELTDPHFIGQMQDPETGLYNFQARLYDPLLRRFLAPDPRGQFASPYVFLGNDPLNMIDPSGGISLAAQIGIGVAMGLVTLLGIALSVFTGGSSGAAAAAIDAEIELDVVATISDVGELEVGTEADVETTVATGGGSGWQAAQQAANAARVVANLRYIGLQAASGGVSGAGSSGLSYDIENGRGFTAKGFFEAIGIGGAAGALGGALGSLGSLTALGNSAVGSYALNVGAQAIGGAASSAFQQILTNVADHQPWSEGVLASMGWGALASGAQALVPTSLPEKWTTDWSEAQKNASKFGLSVLGLAAYNTVEDVPPMVDQVGAAARSADAVAAQLNGTVALMRPYVTSPRRPITISPLRSPFRAAL
jgi:RHS repeat-associated protein